MSIYYIEENILDNTMFPKELYLNNYLYPKFSIQKGNSSGLWFYGIIECIYAKDIFKNIDDVCLEINNNNPDLFIDVINCLSNILYGISDIIDNSIFKTSINIKENKIYGLGQMSTYSFRKEAVMSYYFFFASLFAYNEIKKGHYDEKFNGIKLLLEYQYLIDNIQNFLSLVIFINNYFKIFLPKNIYEINQKNEYDNLIKILKTLLGKVIQNYEKEFNNILYNQFEDKLNYGNQKDKGNIKNTYNKLKITVFKTDKNIIEINKLKKEFEVIKYSERKVVIREESTISKFINPNNEFYFQMMTH